MKKCDICHKDIPMYEPWYSLKVNGHFMGLPKKSEIHIFCPNCFKGYENFLIEREVQENHKQNYLMQLLFNT